MDSWTGLQVTSISGRLRACSADPPAVSSFTLMTLYNLHSTHPLRNLLQPGITGCCLIASYAT